jgi:hypothetical protein
MYQCVFYYSHMYVFGNLNCAYMYTRKDGWDSINRFNPAIFAVKHDVGGLLYVQ